MKRLALYTLIFGVAIFTFYTIGTIGTIEAAPESTGYLAGYDNPDPRPSSMSWWSTIAYIISLLFVFAIVIAMAYFVSRFLSGKLGGGLSQNGGKVLEHLPLGPGRSCCIVELGGRYLMLGVSEGGISLLGEITEPEEIERLEEEARLNPISGDAIAQKITSLQDLVKRVPEMVKDARKLHQRR